MRALDLFAEATPQFSFYRSGSSSQADAEGFCKGGVPIGVTALDASTPVLKRLGAYASQGGQVFIDSGAFRLFMRGEALDYGSVLQAYHTVLSHTDRPQNLLVVAPDVVGDQDESLALLSAWLESVCELIDQGAQVMVPLQRGRRSLAEVYADVTQLLNQRPFVVGLPSNAEALSESDICEFVSPVKPASVHFLGCRERQLFHRLIHLHSSLSITCDASTLRAYIGQDRPLTQRHHSLRDDRLEGELCGEGELAADITELYTAIDSLLLDDVRLLRSLAKALNCNPFTLKQACVEGEALAFAEACHFGYGFQILERWWCTQVATVVSPQCRSEAIAEFVERGVL